MIFCKCLLLFQVQRQDSSDPFPSLERNGKRRSQHGHARRIAEMLGFRHGVTIDDWFVVLCDPPGNSLSYGHLQRTEKVVVDSVHITRSQLFTIAHKEND